MKNLLRRTGIFFCLAVLTASSLAVLAAVPAYAKGEAGKWINATTIELSGGRIQGTATFTGKQPANSADPQSFTSTSGITDQTGCKVYPSITVQTPNADNAILYFGNNDPRNTCTQSISSDYDTSISVSNAAALPGGSTAGTAPAGEDGATVGAVNCEGVGVLGWLICPTVDLMAKVIDMAAGFLNDYLKIKPLTFDTGNPMFVAWSNIRNIANIAFVIVFIMVIYSQATSALLSSYGVRRILPRVIVAAILVNVSYFLSAAAIDISNILGNGVANVIQSVDSTSGGSDPGFGLNIGSLVAAAGIAIILWVFLLVPILLTVISTLFVIGFRTAIVILLTVISPLAFVAWILPNTEKYFKKWLDMFTDMLMLYPLVMGAYAAAVVASNVVRSSSDSTGLAIISLIILALPLFALPFLFKLSSGILGRIENATRANIKRYGGDWAEKQWTGYRQRKMKSLGARMHSNQWQENPESRTRRSVGRAIAFAGGYKARRDQRLKDEDESINRVHEEQYARRIADPDSKLARRAASVEGQAGEDRLRMRALETIRRRETEAHEATQKMESAMSVASPFLSQAVLSSLGTDGKFDKVKFEQELRDRYANGQINQADVAFGRSMAGFGESFTGALMSGSASSLAKSGFINGPGEDNSFFIRQAEQAIRAQYKEHPKDAQIALDRLAAAVNDGAKSSGTAQHMRWGVVGDKLLQNGQDINIEYFEKPNKVAEAVESGALTREQGERLQAAGTRYRQAVTEYQAAEARVKQYRDSGDTQRAVEAERQAADLSKRASDIAGETWSTIQTPLGFQKLPSAEKISRKSFEGGTTASGYQAFKYTINTNEEFEADVILTAAGMKGSMNAQDRAALLKNTKNAVLEKRRREMQKRVEKFNATGKEDDAKQARLLQDLLRGDEEKLWLNIVEDMKDKKGFGSARARVEAMESPDKTTTVEGS